MSEIKYQLIKIKVEESGSTIKFTADTDKKFKSIKGVFASLPGVGSALYGTTLDLRIADNEIFPEEFEIKMLSCGQNVAPDDRFYTQIDEEAQGSRIEGRYTDGGNAGSYPYVAKLYFLHHQKI
jgi:hypothetical protein